MDITIFKNLDAISNGKVDFYVGILNQVQALKSGNNEYKDIDENQLPYYAYLRMCAVFKMLTNLINGDEQYIDFYKTELNAKAIKKAHDLVVGYNIVELLRYNCGNLLKINNAILNRTKIIIKKYFNFKNIKLNKLNKIIKNQSKLLNIDNLLYISYIFNCV